MKIVNFYLMLLLTFFGMSNQIIAIGESDVFINDSIVNKSPKNVTVQIQFNKSIPLDFRASSQDLKKYASQAQITRAVEYIVEPTKELKLYEAFINANPLDNKEYWFPKNVTISTNGLSLTISASRNDIADHLVKSKKYIVSLINNELQVAMENTLKP